MSSVSNNTVIQQRTAVIDVLKTELIRRLNLPYRPEDLHEDISLLGPGLGLDSLDALEVVLCIENCFGVTVPGEGIAVLRSLNTIADFVLAERAKKEQTAR